MSLTGVKAALFRVKTIAKTGFTYVPIRRSYSNEPGGTQPNSSLTNPEKVYLIDEGVCEPLYKRGSYKDIKYGEVWEMDILRRNKKGPTPDQVNLRISCKQLKEHYDTNDWEITIEPPEGIELSLASKHNYVAHDLSPTKLVIKNQDLNYNGHFYIFCHNTREDYYSKIKFEVSGARVRFYSYSNPIKGSKNLAYVKEKRLREWPVVFEPDNE